MSTSQQKKSRIKSHFEMALVRLVLTSYDHPKTTLALTLFCSLLLWVNLPTITFNLSHEAFLPSNDPIIEIYEEFRKEFGRDEFNIIGVRGHDIFAPDFLEDLRKIHYALEDKVPYISSVTSLINATKIEANEDGIVIKKLIDHWPMTKEELASLKDSVSRDQSYHNHVVSKELNFALLIIRNQGFESKTAANPFEEDEERRLPQTNAQGEHDRFSDVANAKFNEVILEICQNFDRPGFEVHSTGILRLNYAYFKSVEHYAPWLIIISSIAIVLCLAVLFRRPSGVILPLIVVSFSIYSTLGLMALQGKPITLVSQILSSFILAVGVGDAVHILKFFFKRYGETGDKRAALMYAVQQTGIAVIMTSLTTICGLLSFTTSDSLPIGELGLFSAFGVTVAFIYTLFLIPPLLALCPIKSITQSNGSSSAIFHKFLNLSSKMALHHPYKILIGCLALTALAIYGITFLRFEHNTTQWFPDDSSLKISGEVINKHIPSSTNIEIIIDSGENNGVTNPEFLEKLEEFVEAIPQITKDTGVRIGSTTSLNQVVKKLSGILNGKSSEIGTIPSDKNKIAQLILLYENAAPENLFSLIDHRFRKARISILLSWRDINTNNKIIERLQQLAERSFPKENITVTGMTTLITRTLFVVMDTMMESYLFAGIVITIIMIILFGSIPIGIISMAPNFVPIIFGMGLMGALNIPLDLTTILVGSISLGLVVDDTIHFFHHFEKEFRKTNHIEKSIKDTLREVGGSITFTTLTLLSGFLVLTISDMKNITNFGLITSFIIFSALLVDLIVSPALVVAYYGRGAKATTVDAGVHETIP